MTRTLHADPAPRSRTTTGISDSHRDGPRTLLGVEDEMLAVNPCHNKGLRRRLGSAPRPKIEVWGPAEASVFLACAEANGPAWAPVAYRLALRFGLRRGEIAALRWSDIDGELVHVRRNTTQAGTVVHTGPLKSKGENHERTIPLAADPDMATLLRAWRKSQMQARLAAGPDWQDTGLIVTNERGAMVNLWRLSADFPTLAGAAGLPRLTLLQGRHTAGSIWLEAGTDIKVISEWLGHFSGDPILCGGVASRAC
jgi:integrase